MDHAEVRGEASVVEVVVVVVDLDGSKLALVDDELGRERADVEPVRKLDGVGCVLAQDVELAAKVASVERLFGLGRLCAIAVVRSQDDNWLQDLWLSAQGSGPEDGIVLGDLSPAEDLEVELGGDPAEDALVLLQRGRVSGLEEDVSNGVLAKGRECDIEVSVDFL